MFNLTAIEIKNTEITNIEAIKQQIKESMSYLENLRFSHSDSYEVICENLKISTNIEESCKKTVEMILNKTGDINELIISLEEMQKEARSLRLELDKARKEFKNTKVNNFNEQYYAILISKSEELSLKLPKSNLKEEVRAFHNSFVLTSFKSVREQDLNLKHEENLKEIENYLKNIEFKIKAFNQSQFVNNFIPINIKFNNGDLLIEFNNQVFTALDYELVKEEYELLIKAQKEQEEARQKFLDEQKVLFEKKEKQEFKNIVAESKVEISQTSTEAFRVEAKKSSSEAMFLKFKNIAKEKINNIVETDVINRGDGTFSVTIIITKEELI